MAHKWVGMVLVDEQCGQGPVRIRITQSAWIGALAYPTFVVSAAALVVQSGVQCGVDPPDLWCNAIFRWGDAILGCSMAGGVNNRTKRSFVKNENQGSCQRRALGVYT